jgi:hypothetical protein
LRHSNNAISHFDLRVKVFRQTPQANERFRLPSLLGPPHDRYGLVHEPIGVFEGMHGGEVLGLPSEVFAVGRHHDKTGRDLVSCCQGSGTRLNVKRQDLTRINAGKPVRRPPDPGRFDGDRASHEGPGASYRFFRRAFHSILNAKRA